VSFVFGSGGLCGVQVQYHDHAFGFEPSPGAVFAGRLVLDDGQRALLTALTAAEDECWYLGEDGERLSAEALFARSPWSTPGPAGPVKLLCRWLDLHDGTVRFNTPNLYLGEFFRWAALGGSVPYADPGAAADGGV
jgi:hypothetical protein